MIEKLKVIIVERFAEQQDIVDWMYKFANTTLARADGGIIAGIGVVFLFWTVIRLANFIEKILEERKEYHPWNNPKTKKS